MLYDRRKEGLVMKKLIYPLMLVLFLGLAGCTKRFTFELGAFENNTSTQMSMSYKKFDGVKDRQLTVKEGESVEINVDIETEDGTLDAYIYNEELEYSYEGKDIETSTFTVTLTEPGEYTIKVEADMHEGSYSFTW